METGIDPVLILKLNLPKKIGIAAGVLAVILFGYWYFFFDDVQIQIETLDGEIAAQVEDINKKDALLRRKPELILELAELAVKEAEASKVLPQEKQIPDLLETVSNKATIQGLKTKLFQPRPEIPSGIYAAIPIDLDVHGSYHQLGMFLDELAKFPRIVKVTEFKAIPLGTKAGEDQLNIRAKASTYRFVEKAPEVPKDRKGARSAKSGRKSSEKQGAGK